MINNIVIQGYIYELPIPFGKDTGMSYIKIKNVVARNTSKKIKHQTNYWQVICGDNYAKLILKHCKENDSLTIIGYIDYFSYSREDGKEGIKYGKPFIRAEKINIDKFTANAKHIVVNKIINKPNLEKNISTEKVNQNLVYSIEEEF